MSHLVTFVLVDKTLYTETCNNIRNKIQQIKNTGIFVDITILQSWENSIQKVESWISSAGRQVEEGQLIAIQRQLSTTEKEVINLYTSTHFQKTKAILEELEKNNLNIVYEISRHGILANEVLEYLQNNNIQVNKTNFDKYLPIVEEENLSSEKCNEYLQQVFKQIDQIDIDDNIKFELKKEARQAKDLKILKDLAAVVVSKENEVLRTKQLIRKILFALQQQNFSIIGPIKWEYDQLDQKVIAKFQCRNAQNNTVQMIADSTMHFKYKLGNYKGHACEKTTEILMNDLKKQNIEISNVTIKRDYETPTLNSMAVREK